MDKPQKELIKTYYRARTLADEQNDAMYGYNKYEIIPYAFDNGLITVEDNEEYAANLIVHNPELIKYFDLNILIDSEITEILTAHPQTVEYFKNMDLDGRVISRVITNRPELADSFDLSTIPPNGFAMAIKANPKLKEKILNQFNFSIENNPDQIPNLLKTAPDLAKYYKFNGLDGGIVTQILMDNPELIKYLKNEIKNIDDEMDLIHLFNKQPQLKKYFKHLSDKSWVLNLK